jgi:hypothetical protein
MDYANKVLVKAFGEGGRAQLLRQVSRAAEMSGTKLDSLRKADPQQLAKFIEGEHPQTIALILAHLESKQASTRADEAAPGVAGRAHQAPGPAAAILPRDGAAGRGRAAQTAGSSGRAEPAGLRRDCAAWPT